MANTSSIVKNMGLVAFRKMFERMQIGDFEHTDEETGEVQHFQSLIFSNGDAKTFVSISSKVKDKSPEGIAANRENLQVVEWKTEDKHGYTLCNKGSNAWKDIEW